jgi:LmbE family N-acetylglucosaminyl deacetylase
MFASHPDHLAAGEATLCAVDPDARNPFAFPELAELAAHSVDEVWLMSGAGNPDTFVDVTDTFDRKVAALRSHASQNLDRDDIGAFLRGWAVKAAEAGGLPEGRLAEGFRRLNTRGA